MKAFLLSSILGLSVLAGCQSTSAGTAMNTGADSRSVDLPGLQARNMAPQPSTLSTLSTTNTSDAPYAIRGNAAPNGNPDFRSHGTTNGF